MNISKAGQAGTGAPVDEAELARIRSFARGELTAEEVYTFSVILCDNDIDRDFERFDEKTLSDLAELFVGKTGISDHDWRSENQVARIYRTEIVKEPGRKCADGRDYVCLKAWAYMLRTGANENLIADIEGGIKKEVSVGCSVARSFCSVCGEQAGNCSHVKGQSYNGQLCYLTLTGAVDAYEWSFVAVPAQRGAGITKHLSVPDGDVSKAAEEALLRKEAALGRQYLAELRGEIRRLALICGRDLYDALTPALADMEADRLRQTKAALEKRVEKLLPIRSQFPGGEEALRFDGAAYLV